MKPAPIRKDVTDQILAALEAIGLDGAINFGDHIHVSVDKDFDLDELNAALPTGAVAEWAGTSNTDAAGDTTEDVRITWSPLRKIAWNKDGEKGARLSINDGADTCYISEDQLPDEFSLQEVAQTYARDYDHNGNESVFSFARIEDLDDSEQHRFAFDGRGNFEWDTTRQS